MSDNLKFATDSLHYVAAANTMIEMEAHREALRKSKELSDKVNAMGYGDSIRTTIADYAGIRDDVRASKAEKRKRTDAHDIRNDLVNSYIPGWAYKLTDPNDPSQPTLFINTDGSQSTDGMSFIFNETHQPRFLERSDNTYLQYAHTHRNNMGVTFLARSDIDPKFHKATQIAQTKKKKRKHKNDPGFRGY